MAEPQGEGSTHRTRRALRTRSRTGEEEGSFEVEEYVASPDDVNRLKRKFHSIIDSATPEDLNDRGRFVADAWKNIQSASLEVMVEDKVKGSLNVVEGKFKEITDHMKNMEKKNSDEMKKISDEMKKNSDEMKKSLDHLKRETSNGFKRIFDELKKNSDEIKKNSDEIKKNSDEVKKISDKLEALPGIVKRALMAPHEMAGQLAEQSVRDSMHNFPEGRDHLHAS